MHYKTTTARTTLCRRIFRKESRSKIIIIMLNSQPRNKAEGVSPRRKCFHSKETLHVTTQLCMPRRKTVLKTSRTRHKLCWQDMNPSTLSTWLRHLTIPRREKMKLIERWPTLLRTQRCQTWFRPRNWDATATSGTCHTSTQILRNKCMTPS